MFAYNPSIDLISFLFIYLFDNESSIDFGKYNDDPARGYWVSCKEVIDEEDGKKNEVGERQEKKKKKKKKPVQEVWYKFEVPHKLYKTFAVKMEYLVQ